jgi:hypothetical protein
VLMRQFHDTTDTGYSDNFPAIKLARKTGA